MLDYYRLHTSIIILHTFYDYQIIINYHARLCVTEYVWFDVMWGDVFVLSPLVLCKCFPVGLPSQNIFEIIIFDYFCKYHDGRGFGKKLGWFDHLNYRKKTTSIYKRDERCGFYFKNQPKETLRGGVLEDRKNLTCCLLCFATWLPQGTG